MKRKVPSASRLTAMKLFLICAVAAATGPWSVRADENANAPDSVYSLLIAADSPNALYHTGDLVTFTIKLKGKGRAFEGARARWVLSKDGGAAISTGEVKLKDGECVAQGRLDEPGFLRCDAAIEIEGDKEMKVAACVGIDPWLVTPSEREPANFDNFWEVERKRLSEVPINPRLDLVRSQLGNVEAFDLQADCIGPALSGSYARPTGAKPKSLPGILILEDENADHTNPAESARWASHGLMALDIGARGVPADLKIESSPPANGTETSDSGLSVGQPAETAPFLGTYLRVMRAIDFLESQPEWDGRTLIVSGRGQGGALAIAGGALDARVSLVVAAMPAFCDLPYSTVGSPSGRQKTIPDATESNPRTPAPDVAGYFDSVNFAGRIKGDAQFTVGFLDAVCPPTGVYLAFNEVSNLKLKKQILNYPARAHGPANSEAESLQVAILKHISDRNLTLAGTDLESAFVAPYPKSSSITGVTFDNRTLRTEAEGSDMWPITWAEDDNIYTCYGDGGGFGGTDTLGRVSFGVSRVTGGRKDYKGANLAGGVDSQAPSPFNGKGVGLIALGNTLYLWRAGDASSITEFKFTELWRSDDLGLHWRPTGVRFSKRAGDFSGGDEGFYCPVFCEYGRGNSGARDDFVYIYAPDVIDPSSWYVQVPGRISLFRVAKSKIQSKADYEFFAGMGSDNMPIWTSVPSQRKPVWSDPVNGTHRMAVSYNPGLRRYLLTTVTINRRGWMSIYDAPEPWGPWTHVNTELNPQRWGTLTILFSFVNKWLSPDGRHFVMVYAKNDHWATVEGRFIVPGN